MDAAWGLASQCRNAIQRKPVGHQGVAARGGMSAPKRWATLVDEDNDAFPRSPVYLAQFDEPAKCTSFATLACSAVERRSSAGLRVISRA